MADKVTVEIGPIDPSVPAAFSNFLAVSRVSTEVQFEFIFVDTNRLVAAVRDPDDKKKLEGTTVAKVILPALSFVQLRDHFQKLFTDIENEFAPIAKRLMEKKESEAENDSVRISGQV